MARKTNGALAGAMTLRRSALYGFGWVMRNEFVNSGREYIYTDTGGILTRAPGSGEWNQMFRIDFSVASEHIDDDLDFTQGSGGYSIAPCFTDPDKGVLAMVGRWWRFIDAGLTANSITPIAGFPIENLNGNEDVRMIGPTSACDPGNANHACQTTPTGLYYIDGPGNAIKHQGIGAAQGNVRICVAYDPSSATVGGKKQGWYVFEPNVGLKRSTTGLAGSFALVAGSPTLGQGITVAIDGTVYLTNLGEGKTTGLRRYKPGVGWSGDLKPDCHGVAVHPTNANWLWSVNQGGSLSFSDNQGDNWATHNGATHTADDVPGLSATEGDYMSAGGIKWDASIQGISFTAGLGVWIFANAPTTLAAVAASTTTWVSRTKGIAQKCVDDLVVVHAPGTPSDGDVMATGQDRGIFVITRDGVDTPPTGHGPNYFQGLTHGSTSDYAPNAPHYRVTCVRDNTVPGLGNRVIFESYNRGFANTWAPIDNPPDDAYSGNIACGGIGRIFYHGMIQDTIDNPNGNNTKRAFIKKPGQAWYPADIAGGRSLGNSDSGYTSKTRRVCHNPFVPGEYFIFPTGDGSGSADDLAVTGIHCVKDDGTPAVKLHAALETQALNYWGVSTKPNPLRQNHFGYTAGLVGGDDNPGGSELWLTTDKWSNVKALPGFGEVYDFDYMPADVGEPYERLLLVGMRNDGEFGTWLIYNLDLVPTIPTYQYQKLDRWPLGWFDYYSRVAADKTMFGRGYLGGSGSGLTSLDYVCKRRYVA